MPSWASTPGARREVDRIFPDDTEPAPDCSGVSLLLRCTMARLHPTSVALSCLIVLSCAKGADRAGPPSGGGAVAPTEAPAARAVVVRASVD